VISLFLGYLYPKHCQPRWNDLRRIAVGAAASAIRAIYRPRVVVVTAGFERPAAQAAQAVLVSGSFVYHFGWIAD
jgi:hypothetical protein